MASRASHNWPTSVSINLHSALGITSNHITSHRKHHASGISSRSHASIDLTLDNSITTTPPFHRTRKLQPSRYRPGVNKNHRPFICFSRDTPGFLFVHARRFLGPSILSSRAANTATPGSHHTSWRPIAFVPPTIHKAFHKRSWPVPVLVSETP